MLKQLVLISVAMGLLLTLLCRLVTAQALTTKEALDLLDDSLQAIKSFDVRVEVTRRFYLDSEFSGKGRDATLIRNKKRESPVVNRHSFRQVYELGRGRIEFLDSSTGKAMQHIVYTLEAEKTWNPKQMSSVVRAPTPRLIGDGEDYRETFANAYGRLSLVRCFRERNNVIVKDLRPENQVVILETAPTARDPKISLARSGFRARIDLRRGFIPSEIERFEEIKGKPFVCRRTTVTDAKNIGNGIWVPIKIITKIFDNNPDTGMFGEVDCEVVMTVDVSQSSWNRKIPEETFELPIPARTKVTDAFRGVQYVTGKPDPGKNLKDLAEHARGVVKVSMGPPPATSSGWPPWLITGLAVIAGGMILGGAFLYYRKRQLARQK